jgi:hypothetical protein
VIIRFLGVTPLSSDIRRPLISIIQQICILYQIELSCSILNSLTIEKLKEQLEYIFTQIPTNEQLILLFDSIDQLQVENYDCSKWLPANYPSNIKYILSTIPLITERKSHTETIEYKILEGLQSFLGDDIALIEITTLDERQAQETFQWWLERDRRRLTSLQMSWLQPKLVPYTPLPSAFDEPEPTPLFLSLLYDMTLTWHSFDDKCDLRLPFIKTTQKAIESLYQRMSKKHGNVLFRRAMTYLQLAGGLNETELEDMLSADNTVLQSIFLHYLPPYDVFRLPGTLWIRIRNDMHKYLVEKEVDNTNVIYL